MKKGFTLIELLGVIVILGLIVAVAVPSLIESNRQAQLNEEKDFENTLELAAKDYISFYSDPDLCVKDSDTYDACVTQAQNYENLYTQNGSSEEITTATLTQNDRFLKKTLIDPFTNNIVDNENITIKMVNNNGKLKIAKITIITSDGKTLEKDISNE